MEQDGGIAKIHWRDFACCLFWGLDSFQTVTLVRRKFCLGTPGLPCRAPQPLFVLKSCHILQLVGLATRFSTAGISDRNLARQSCRR
jgi:hypothetical protein